MRFYKIVFLLSVVCLVFSCKTPADVAYFQESSDQEKITIKNSFTPVLKVDDVISILVSASDMDAARPFNLMQGSTVAPISGGETTGTSGGGNTGEPSYLIDEQGNIEFPVLGVLKVAGLTRVEVKQMIKEKLKIYIKDPIVSVRLKNFKITVIGEVNGPGSFTIPNERITIIEALGLARDMTIKGRRDNVLVIRENDGVNTYHRVDMTSKEIFDSPVYYLAQNDVLYVEPNNSQKRNSKTNNNALGIIVSVVGIALSAVALILR